MQKNVLVVGAGSLGSYIACELAKNGFSKFTIYDEDILQSENYMRWYYGGLLTGTKVNALKLLLENTHPEIVVEAIDKNISVNDILNIMNKFDYIFFTVGNSDTQLQFNKILKKYGCTAKVFFVWLEAGGKYSHILRINYQSQGCYECLFTNEYGQKVNNKATIEKNDNFFDSRVIHNGCGGTRAAYGSAVLLRTTATLLDLLHKEDINNNMDNYLVDIFPEKTSTMQIDFVEKECDCCGHGSE